MKRFLLPACLLLVSLVLTFASAWLSDAGTDHHAMVSWLGLWGAYAGVAAIMTATAMFVAGRNP